MIEQPPSIDEVFGAALALQGAERDSYLDAACHGQPALRQRICRLLKAHPLAQSFLETPAVACDAAATIDSQDPTIGTQIGPYKLLELIGEGGMGLVYMAEQQRPVRRLVALKIIKPGLDSRQVIARFEAERQALAMMDHPGIAKILEAGTVGEGVRDQEPGVSNANALSSVTPDSRLLPSGSRPYFVMELVRGLPITEFCDHKQYTVRQRLELFIQVCQAVQHAHQKGIIHRDLKPTNVLVTMHDALAVPKIIDFGIAKALQIGSQESGVGSQESGGRSQESGVGSQGTPTRSVSEGRSQPPLPLGEGWGEGVRLTEKTLHTGFAQMIGTPLYMSPEQAEMNQFGVDTRSDVYSLGVLLYELLTGTTPFDKERLKSAGFDEMRRIIREEEAETVSRRLARTRRVGQARAASAGPPIENRADKRRWAGAPLVPPYELDWIVARCLEKDPARRYESASALAADIQRYLANEPVQACPPSAGYRLAKFASRNKRLLLLVGCVAATLFTGLIGTTWQAVRATRAQQLADKRLHEQALAERRAQQSAQQAEQAAARARAEAQRANAEAQRATANAEEVKVQFAAGEALYQFLNDDVLGQANPHKQPQRDVLLKTVLDRAAERIGDRFQDQPLAEAGIRLTLGRTYLSLGEFASAELHLVRAHDLRLQVLGANDPLTLGALNALGSLYGAQGNTKEADRVTQQVLESIRQVDGDEQQRTLVAMAGRANSLRNQGRYQEAEALYLQTIEIRIRLFGATDQGMLTTKHNLAASYVGEGRFAEALAILEPVVAARRAALGDENVAVLNSMNLLARTYAHLDRFEEAEALFQNVLNIMVRLQRQDHPIGFNTQSNFASLRMRQKRYAEAESLYLVLLERIRCVKGAEHPDTLVTIGNLALAYQHQRKDADAERLYQGLLTEMRQKRGAEHRDTLQLMLNLAAMYQVQQKYADAEPLLQQVLDARRRALGPDHHSTVKVMSSLGLNCLLQHKHAEAERLLRACVVEAEQARPDDWVTFYHKSLLGEAVLALAGELAATDPDAAGDRLVEAELLLLSGYAGLKSNADKDDPASRLTDALERLVSLYTTWEKPDEAARWKAELDLQSAASATSRQ